MDQESAIELVSKCASHFHKHLYDIRKVYMYGLYAKRTNRENGENVIALMIICGLKNIFPVQIYFMRLQPLFDFNIEPHPIDEDDYNNFHPFLM